jgi:hypothetical protein
MGSQPGAAARWILYVDCEVDRTLEQAGFSQTAMFSRNSAEAHFEKHAAHARMMVTVAVTRRSDEDAARVHTPHGGAAAAGRLLGELDAADVICAWNAGRVLALLAKYAPGGAGGLRAAAWRDKALDPMVALRDRLSGQWPSLHSVAGGEGGGRAEEAVALYAAGQLAALARALERDVGLLKGVAEALMAGGAVRAPVTAALAPGGWQARGSRSVSTQTQPQAEPQPR